MPAKKKTAKTTAAKKTSSKRSAANYECPNSGPQYNLTQIIEKMIDDESFAKFIKKLLCKMLNGTTQAQRDEAADCLGSYFAPTSGELDKLCLSEDDQDRINDTGCTDRTTLAILIDVPAYITVNLRSRLR
jgi:hypothetical protein